MVRVQGRQGLCPPRQGWRHGPLPVVHHSLPGLLRCARQSRKRVLSRLQVRRVDLLHDLLGRACGEPARPCTRIGRRYLRVVQLGLGAEVRARACGKLQEGA